MPSDHRTMEAAVAVHLLGVRVHWWSMTSAASVREWGSRGGVGGEESRQSAGHWHHHASAPPPELPHVPWPLAHEPIHLVSHPWGSAQSPDG